MLLPLFLLWICAVLCRRRKLLVISLDGFRFDYLYRGVTPNLCSLESRGVAGRMLPQFPSLTFPNHYSMVTGLRPSEHGIVGNAFYDPSTNSYFQYTDSEVMKQPEWWLAEPIWKTIERSGLSAGVVFWPGSETIGMQPADWVEYDSQMDTKMRLKMALKWLTRHDLVMTYISSLDGIGHDYGPDSPEVAAELARLDKVLGEELSPGLTANTNVIIVSDHGMVQIRHRVPIELLLEQPKKRLRWIDYGPIASLLPKAGQEESVLMEIRASIKRLGLPIKAYTPTEIPAHFHFRDNPRIAPITLICPPGWVVDHRRRDALSLLNGMHGYDPAHPSMHALFIGIGPDFKRSGKVFALLSNLDLYPLMCRLLQSDCLPDHHGSEKLSKRVLKSKS